MITKSRKYTGEKCLGGLYEPFPRPKNTNDVPIPDAETGGILISEPDFDNRSVPPDATDWEWQA